MTMVLKLTDGSEHRIDRIIHMQYDYTSKYITVWSVDENMSQTKTTIFPEVVDNVRFEGCRDNELADKYSRA